MSALLMELYPRLRLRYPMIPEIKLLMPLVGVSLPEREWGHTTPGAFTKHDIFVSNARSGDIPLSYRRRMMAPWNPDTAIARY